MGDRAILFISTTAAIVVAVVAERTELGFVVGGLVAGLLLAVS